MSCWSHQYLTELGFGPSQFSITVGSPDARARQLYFATFVQDDWTIRPNLTLSAGLRYEMQTNVGKKLNLAPRVRFAWAPGKGRNSKRTVIRGGIGIFYDQLDEDLTLQAARFNGITQQQRIVTDPTALQSFPNLPELNDPDVVPQTIIRVADDIRNPYTLQTALGIDHQLPHNITISATYLRARAFNLLRSRNINAPLPGTYSPDDGEFGVRPFGGVNNIYVYESSGISRQDQVLIRFTTRLGRKANFFGTYVWNRADSDTDGPTSFPANSYDLSTEYGRSLLDVRQRLFIGGTINLPWKLNLNPLIVASSGRPFNITTGSDTNGDTVFSERPAFATDLNKSGVVVTRFGAFDLHPSPGQTIIPRNFGSGPSQFTVNLRLSKTLYFWTRNGGGSSRPNAGGEFGDEPAAQTGSSENRYSLQLALRVQNVFNRVNPAQPVGNLSSLLFGQSTSSARSAGLAGNPVIGSRRVELQVGFTF